MRQLSTLLITTAVLTLAGTASAQTRHGFFIGGGLGYGSGDASTDGTRQDLSQIGGLDSGRSGGPTLNLRLGKTLSPRLAVGAELNGYFRSNVSLFNATAAFYLYPSDAGFFVKGGLGLARAGVSLGADDVHGLGFGAMLGLGYDYRIGAATAVTPMAAYWFGSPGELSVDNIDLVHGFKHNVIEIGVGVTFY